ncbi:Mobile element protein [Candidatus Enterovibrio altilux]|uniref:Mobile element protein n=1 Tax=Candidatus Enterovibrio altilux TaxID=1927128 RepID=A0A291B6D0_9GAMM|nr:Mobile element protein [Candidatus Enterovibrio luxaltus]
MLIEHDSLTFRIDEEIIQLRNQTKRGKDGKLRLFSDEAIMRAFMVKCVFSMLLRG